MKKCFSSSLVRSVLRTKLPKRHDAFSVAEQARSALQRGETDLVYHLIGNNHKLNLTVTWNHLIRHKLAQGRINSAIADFSDMKKRGHWPDEYTYSAILLGLSHHARDSDKFIDLLLGDARIKLNTVLLNTAIRKCRDIERMQYIIQRFKERGVECDLITYTTLLHALRSQVERRPSAKSLESLHRTWGMIKEPDDKALKIYVQACRAGDERDHEMGLFALCKVCGIPRHDEVKTLSRTIHLTPDLFIELIHLVSGIGFPRAIEHYWREGKIAIAGQMTKEIYLAKFKGLYRNGRISTIDSTLDEMKSFDIPFDNEILEWVLKCHGTRSEGSLDRALKILDDRPLTFPIIAALSSILHRAKDDSPGRIKTSSLLTRLATFPNWSSYSSTFAAKVIRSKLSKQLSLHSDPALVSFASLLISHNSNKLI